jgi:hypothetical protein
MSDTESYTDDCSEDSIDDLDELYNEGYETARAAEMAAEAAEDGERAPINVYRKQENISTAEFQSLHEIQFRGYYNMWRLILVYDNEVDRAKYLAEFINYYKNYNNEANNSLHILGALATVFVGESAALGDYNKVCYAIRQLLKGV